MNPLDYYSRTDVQRELVKSALYREVGIKFGDKGFGYRPDILQFEGDVLELAKQGATSFHLSEERWLDPMQLEAGMSKKQLDRLRNGWDLILDIDCKNLEFSKIAAELLVDALWFYNMHNIGVKFSGGSGFHISIMFEAFPPTIQGRDLKNFFPEGPRIIAAYLKSMIKGHLRDKILERCSLKDIAEKMGKNIEKLTEKICTNCSSNIELEIAGDEFICTKCGKSSKDASICNDCNTAMKRIVIEKKQSDCTKCGKKEFKEMFNPFSVLEIDTVLISSRHMIRAPYSINEKTWLVSIPILPDEIKNFDIVSALPENIKPNVGFFIPPTTEEAKELAEQAFNFVYKKEISSNENDAKTKVKYDANASLKGKADCKFFPPCILDILSGVKEDGRKRSLFILMNFLRQANWDFDGIEQTIFQWNKKNYEELRENYIKSQLNWSRKSHATLPPNCNNENYYKSMLVCKPDGICKLIKNPVNYVWRKTRLEKQYEQETKTRKAK